MLEKLLSLVPYNPGMTHQLAFYSHRMKEEASIRRIGLVFMVLAFVVQSVAVLSPPQSAVAGSSNDLLNGGFSSRDQARAACVADTNGYQRILHHYGISCTAFDASDAETLFIHSTGQDYFSSGHNPTGVARETSEINISGIRSIYFRPLSTWGNPSSGWKVIRLHDQDGKTYYVMYDCGNLVSVGVPTPKKLTEQATPFTPTPVTPVVKPTPVTPAPTPLAPEPSPVPPETTTTPATVVIPQCKYNDAIKSNDARCKACPYNSNIWIESTLCYKPCIYNGSIPDTDSACKPCDKSTSKTDSAACVAVRKTAANITAGLSDANNSTAKAGDVITYTLFAQNNGKAAIKDFVFQENMSDVLDYADVTDAHGGLLSTVNKVIAWPTMDLPAGTTNSVQVTVKVKDPIPQTTTGNSDPAHFDLIMTNVYGNAVNIKLPAGPGKNIESVATTLPNTGPGAALLVSASIVILAGYFYSRATLLARESDIALKETATL